ncbi:hypothetical protein ACSSS7_005702 [Eimeria intestinalis]
MRSAAQARRWPEPPRVVGSPLTEAPDFGAARWALFTRLDAYVSSGAPNPHAEQKQVATRRGADSHRAVGTRRRQRADRGGGSWCSCCGEVPGLE